MGSHNIITIKYLSKLSLSYCNFLEKYYGTDNFKFRLDKLKWYLSRSDFKILVAEYNGCFVGQSCAYKDAAVVNNEDKEIWWSVDTFVLPDFRGMGIGKMLQKKLHNDCSNFTSASYSKANGIIKRKCGAKEIFKYYRGYYPVSCFFSLMTCAFIKHIFHKNGRNYVRLPFFYYYLNKIMGLYTVKKYCYKEILSTEINNTVLTFINNCLSDSDFYIKRNLESLHWKYLQNPSIKFHTIEIMQGDTIVGVVFFSEDYNGKWLNLETRLVMILDMFVKEGTIAIKKAALLSVMEFYAQKGVNIDGILSLQDISFWPKYKTTNSVLSTMDANRIIKSPYISYIDHDMGRMY